VADGLAGQTGRVVVVTGGARGIGLGIARRLSRDGYRVALWDLAFVEADLDALPEVADAPCIQVDVSDADSVERALVETERQLGAVDILINNAGINGPVAPVWELSVDDWRRIQRIDLDSVFLCSRAVIPGMRARRWGRIVNIASMAGKEGVPGISSYAAAKGGVIAFTKSIARELCEDGVMVNAVAPAMVETPLLQQMTAEHIAAMKSRIPMGRLVQVEDVANLVAFIVGPDCSFTTGFTFDVSGGRAVY
jgi:2-dehydro-3-deoxy-L-rhamnonate dehydrogenase (NAD+)